MNSRVLIVGNGISRLGHEDYIRAYQGEVWACNYAYKEFPDIITRLTGHDFALVDAQAYKDEHHSKFVIYSGPIAQKREGWKLFTCPPQWLRDSGTTMVAQALYEGHDVDLIGFDLGGPDVNALTQYQQDKTCWVRRWAEIVETWGAERLHFIGHDHLPYIKAVILDPQRAKDYARNYKARRPHIATDEYKKIHMEAIMLGKQKPAEPAKRVKYMETGAIVTISAAVAAIYKKKDPDGELYRILGDAKEEPKKEKKSKPEKESGEAEE